MDVMKAMHRLRRFVARFGPPLAFTVIVYGVVQVVVGGWFKVPLKPSAVPADLALHLVLAVVLLAVSRSRGAFVALLLLLVSGLHIGNALKITILGGPIMPDDLLAVRSLFLIMERWQLVLAGGFLLLLTVAAARALTLRPLRARLAAAGSAGAVALVAIDPSAVAARMDQTFGNVVWDQRANYLSRGAIVHLVQEGARYAGRSERPPVRGEVMAAVDLLRPPVQDATLAPADPEQAGPERGPRNVHMIVLESFWDPSVLTKAEFSRDPFDAEFRAMWTAAGNSRVLAPVFGGYTANSEFEALCGFPVTEDAVFFEARLRKAAPCLPRLFAEAGYATVASHPNTAVFWNRVNAYDRAGFDVYWSRNHFDLDDMNGDFLGDASLYRQVLDKVAPLLETGTPTFNYILTFFGHLDYPLNGSRPRVVHVADDERLERYANTVYYKTVETMAFVAELQRRDPDAVIVLFGDHLPFLGGNFESYVRSGVLGADRSTFDARMFLDMVATPLIVIDGRNGPVPLGTLPLYQLPTVVRALAGLDGPAPSDFTAGTGPVIRPLPGLALVVGEDGAPVLCRGTTDDDADVCTEAKAWTEAVHTLSIDLFSGRQHVLKESLGGEGAEDDPDVAFTPVVLPSPDSGT